ncbi:MAG: BspA family leucine-rich repeat surface protein [Prevotella sp.]|nr:BspA family leucine-rich repeat surface protein [Prevotella sp.]
MAQVNSFKAKSKKILAPSTHLLHVFLPLLLFLPSVKIQAQEMYAVINDGIATLYYDNLRWERSGDVRTISTVNRIFKYGEEVTKIVFDNSFSEARPTSTAFWFSGGLKSLKEIDGFEYLNTSNVTNMSCMFDGCSSLSTLDLSHFDTSNVTNMMAAFRGCSSLTTLDLSHFDTSNVTEMSSLFRECSSLTFIDMSHFDTKNVTNMSEMFNRCSSLTTLDLSHFDTRNVTNMVGVFRLCSGLTALDLSHFDTNNATTTMAYMFEGCSSLTTLDLSHFDTKNVTNMAGMFKGCSSLTALDLSHFDTSKVTEMSGLFLECSGLKDINLSNFNTQNVTAMVRMFSKCYSLECVDMSSFNTEGLDTSQPYRCTYAMFEDCIKLTTVTIGKYFSLFSDYTFYGCQNIRNINSHVENPFPFSTNIFGETVYKYATLNVPTNTKALYASTEGWKEFKTIIEVGSGNDNDELEPISEADNTDYGNGGGINDDTDLNGNVIGNIYYNISDENGEYSSTEGCIILKKSSTDNSMEGKDLFDEELKINFTGIIFMVQGNGTIKVNAETVGSMTLKVKIGNNQPVTMELEGKMKASFPYTVTEPTYVYIYGGETASANARGMRRAESTENALKIYGIEWSESDIPSHVEAIRETSLSDTPIIYNLQGQRMQSTSRGINIVNGKKIFVK